MRLCCFSCPWKGSHRLISCAEQSFVRGRKPGQPARAGCADDGSCHYNLLHYFGVILSGRHSCVWKSLPKSSCLARRQQECP